MKKSELREFIHKQVEKALVENYEAIDEAAFSRMHYVQIANILKNSKTKDEVAEHLVAIFNSDNPRFDEGRFRTAAGMKPKSPGVFGEVSVNTQFDPMDKSIKIETKKVR